MRDYNHAAELRKRAQRERLAKQADAILAGSGSNSRPRSTWDPPVHRPDPKPPYRGNVDSNWPAYVTMGPLTDKGLTIVILYSRAEADSLGYDWVGRPEPIWE